MTKKRLSISVLGLAFFGLAGVTMVHAAVLAEGDAPMTGKTMLDPFTLTPVRVSSVSVLPAAALPIGLRPPYTPPTRSPYTPPTRS